MTSVRLVILVAVLGGGVLAFPAVAAPIDADQATTGTQEQVAEPSPFGKFPAQTDAERELEVMLAGPEDQIDLALANWLIVADLPAYQNMTREQYFAMLDQATNRVRGMIEFARQNPSMAGPMSDPDRLCYVFCSGIIGLGIDYKEEFKQYQTGPTDVRDLYRDADNVFLAGLLKTGYGSCVSLPQLYLVIGQRLDMPIYLVTIGQHSFVRWQEDDYKMNIETTIVSTVARTPTEENFFQAEELTREDIKGSNALENLNKREVVGELLYARCGWYYVQGPEYTQEFLRDLWRARKLSPNNSNIKKMYEDTLAQMNQYRQQQSMRSTPQIQRRRPSPWAPKPPMPQAPRPPFPNTSPY